MTTVRMLAAAVLCSALALSACQKKADTAATDTASADAAAPAAADAATDAAATTTPTAGTPAECQAYLDHVNACTTKLASSNAMVADQMRKTMETTKASWAQITDQAALASACKQADDAYTASSAAMGC